MVANSSEPFVVQYNLHWIVFFSNIPELKPAQEEALLHFIKPKDVFAVLPTGCGKSFIFQIVPRVRAYLHNRGFNFPKAAVSVVVCSLTALIDAHRKELKDHANLANKNYCCSIRRKENSEILHSRKLIGLFWAMSIFLSSMEEVILLGLPGTIKSSLTWSSGGNTFSFCLNKDLGGILGRELNVDFFLAGLLEVGELLWHLSTCVPRSVIWASDQPSP